MLIKIYDPLFLGISVFDIATYEKQLCIQYFFYPELHIRLIRGGEKEGIILLW